MGSQRYRRRTFQHIPLLLLYGSLLKNFIGQAFLPKHSLHLENTIPIQVLVLSSLHIDILIFSYIYNSPIFNNISIYTHKIKDMQVNG